MQLTSKLYYFCDTLIAGITADNTISGHKDFLGISYSFWVT